MTFHDLAAKMRSQETAGRLGEFSHLSWLLLRAKGDRRKALSIAESDRRHPTPTSVRTILKAAVAGSDLSEAEGFPGLVAAFSDSLASRSVFDAVLSSAVRVPFGTPVLSASTAAVGSLVAEGEAKPVSRLSLAADSIERLKASAICVVTDQQAEAAPRLTMSFISRELRRAAATAVDGAFLDGLAADLTPIVSTGPAEDLAALLAAVSLGADSRLVLAVAADVAAQMATITDGGAFLHPGMTPLGGTAAGINVVVSDALDAGTALLIDASGVAVAADPFELDIARHASIAMDTEPTMASASGSPPAPTAASQVSMWQVDASAVRMERWFGYKLIRADAVAAVTGVAYGGSPA
jgi:HK97 family phage major capsid protein